MGAKRSDLGSGRANGWRLALFVPTRPIISLIAAGTRSPMGDMTGDAPQPGETPRDDGTPWARADPASPWWRADDQDPAADRSRRAATAPKAAAAAATPTLDPPQPAQHTGAAAEAHQAAAQDVR